MHRAEHILKMLITEREGRIKEHEGFIATTEQDLKKMTMSVDEWEIEVDQLRRTLDMLIKQQSPE